MGDFVRRMEREESVASENGTLSLPGLDAPPDIVGGSSDAHEPITDFTLHTSAELPCAELLKLWPPADWAAHSVWSQHEPDDTTAVVREQPQSATYTAPQQSGKTRYPAPKGKPAKPGNRSKPNRRKAKLNR